MAFEQGSEVSRPFDEFIGLLESRYEPRWSVYQTLTDSICRSTALSVFDFACGTASLIRSLDSSAWDGKLYVGYDIDRDRAAVGKARASTRFRSIVTTELTEFRALLRENEGLVVLSFCLHDIANPMQLAEMLCADGAAAIVAWDLNTMDLPRLRDVVGSLAAPVEAADPRGNVSLFRSGILALGYHEIVWRTQEFAVTFQRQEEVMAYLRIFNILGGDDWRLPPIQGEPVREAALSQLIDAQEYPFRDDRSFSCLEVVR